MTSPCCTLNRYDTSKHVRSCPYFTPMWIRAICWLSGRPVPRVVKNREDGID